MIWNTGSSADENYYANQVARQFSLDNFILDISRPSKLEMLMDHEPIFIKIDAILNYMKEHCTDQPFGSLGPIDAFGILGAAMLAHIEDALRNTFEGQAITIKFADWQEFGPYIICQMLD
ncbi:MAG: hypothetical protein LBT32_06190 [Peptococcaceae bacterium]|jgi:hypothetical protein|nr:hypothetical protein [Peptococcaceae bacterium]